MLSEEEQGRKWKFGEKNSELFSDNAKASLALSETALSQYWCCSIRTKSISALSETPPRWHWRSWRDLHWWRQGWSDYKNDLKTLSALSQTLKFQYSVIFKRTTILKRAYTTTVYTLNRLESSKNCSSNLRKIYIRAVSNIVISLWIRKKFENVLASNLGLI